jgi:hypothetical protein
MALALKHPLRRRDRPADAPVEARPAGDTAVTADARDTAAATGTAGPSRGRAAAAGVAAGIGGVLLTIARLIRLVAGVVALVIGAAIVLRLLAANPANTVVRDVHDAGRALAGPFKDLFLIKNPKTSILVNWGIAAAVYLIVGGLIASLFARTARRARRRTV